MVKTLSILLMSFVLITCSNRQKSIAEYESHKVKFAKSKFIAYNGEFSIMLPANWSADEDSVDSDSLLYIMESISQDIADSNYFYILIAKAKVIYGDMENEFDLITQELLERVTNVKLIEKSEIIIDQIKSKTVHLGITYNDQITHENIEIFIPFNSEEYYYIVLISERNDQIENNFGMMLECAKSFKLSNSHNRP